MILNYVCFVLWILEMRLHGFPKEEALERAFEIVSNGMVGIEGSMYTFWYKFVSGRSNFWNSQFTLDRYWS